MQAYGRVGRTDNGLIQRAIAGIGRMVATEGTKGRRQSRQRSRYPDGRGSPSDGESRWCDEGPRHPDAWLRRHDGSTRPSGPNVPGMQVHGRAGATNDAAIRRDGTVIRMHGWGSRFDEVRWVATDWAALKVFLTLERHHRARAMVARRGSRLRTASRAREGGLRRPRERRLGAPDRLGRSSRALAAVRRARGAVIVAGSPTGDDSPGAGPVAVAAATSPPRRACLSALRFATGRARSARRTAPSTPRRGTCSRSGWRRSRSRSRWASTG